MSYNDFIEINIDGEQVKINDGAYQMSTKQVLVLNKSEISHVKFKKNEISISMSDAKSSFWLFFSDENNEYEDIKSSLI